MVVHLLIHYWSTSTVTWFYFPVVFDWYFQVTVIDQIWRWALVGNRQRPTSTVDVVQFNFPNRLTEHYCLFWTMLHFVNIFRWAFGTGLLLPWVFRSVCHRTQTHQRFKRRLRPEKKAFSLELYISLSLLLCAFLSLHKWCQFFLSIVCNVCTYMDLNNSWMCHA